jgi:chemotaxis protein CheX
MLTTTTYDAEVEQIVQTIFSTMLNVDLWRMPGEPATERVSLAASIQIAGEWFGSVVLGLSPAAARAAAAAMMHLSDPDVTDADQQDVAAELVNMIGGNLKSLLPGPSYLSLPTVAAGREFGVQVHDAELVDDVWFGSDAGCIRVRLYTKTSEPNG